MTATDEEWLYYTSQCQVDQAGRIKLAIEGVTTDGRHHTLSYYRLSRDTFDGLLSIVNVEESYWGSWIVEVPPLPGSYAWPYNTIGSFRGLTNVRVTIKAP